MVGTGKQRTFSAIAGVALLAGLPAAVLAAGTTGPGPSSVAAVPCASATAAAGNCQPAPTAIPTLVGASVTGPPPSTIKGQGTGVNTTFGDGTPIQRAQGIPVAVISPPGISGVAPKTVSLAPLQVRTNVVQRVDQGGLFCGPYTGGLAPYVPDTSSLLTGYYHFYNDDHCWLQQDEVYRGGIHFDHPAIRWDRITSAKLYYRAHLIADKSSDGSFMYGGDYCGFGDQLLLADNSTWWNNPNSGNGDYPLTHTPFDTGASEWLWAYHSSDDMRALPSGTPLSTATLTPAKGISGIDVTALVQNWQEYPGDNNGLILRNTVSEAMDAKDKAACMTEYGDFRLEITYTES
jgi:hypothetical protein